MFFSKPHIDVVKLPLINGVVYVLLFTCVAVLEKFWDTPTETPGKLYIKSPSEIFRDMLILS